MGLSLRHSWTYTYSLFYTDYQEYQYATKSVLKFMYNILSLFSIQMFPGPLIVLFISGIFLFYAYDAA